MAVNPNLGQAFRKRTTLDSALTDPSALAAPVGLDRPTGPQPGLDSGAPQVFNDPSNRTTSIPPPTPVGPVPPPVDQPTNPNAGSLGPLTVNPDGTVSHQPATSPIVVPNVPPSVDPIAPQGAAPPATPPALNPLNTALKDALLKLLGQGDPTLDDPALAAQSGAFGVQQQRAKERARSAMAERFAANGGPGVDSGAFDSELRSLDEQQGEAQGGFDAQLLGDERAKRHQELLQAAALAGNQLSEEEKLAFQKELAATSASQFDRNFAQSAQQWAQQFGLEGQKLAETVRQFDTTTKAGQDALRQQLEIFKAQMGEQGREFDVDAELKKLGINQQGALGQGDLDLRRFLGEGNLNLGLLSALLQNQQFGQGLGAQLGMFNTSQNNNLLQALLAALGQAA